MEVIRCGVLKLRHFDWVARKCFEFGLTLAHVRVIPDQREEIVSSICELSSKYSLVFTSGGIGKACALSIRTAALE